MEEQDHEENKGSDQEAVDSSGNVSDGQDAFNKEDLQCRYYRNEWPEQSELVVVSQSPI